MLLRYNDHCMFFLYFSTLKCSYKSPSKDTAGSSNRLTICTILAHPDMVVDTNKDADTSTMSAPK